MIKNKKTISPVVAIALLLVVSVVAVISFQNWFVSYSSSVFSDVEIKSDIGSMSTGIKKLVDENLYFVNNGNSNIVINRLMVGEDICVVSDVILEPGINKIDIGVCLVDANSIESIVIITDKNIYSKTLMIGDVFVCPENFIKVPGNVYFGIDDFCVMKFEAKNIGGVATSQANELPWTNINFTESKQKCIDLGLGYHLITNREWMTIARNIEQTDASWTGGSVGSGYIKSGNSGTLVGQYNGNNPENSSYGVNNLGLLNLSNGNSLWDFSGNVHEFVDATENDSTLNGQFCLEGGTQYYNYNGTDCTFVSPYNSSNAVDKRFEVGPSVPYSDPTGYGRVRSSGQPTGIFVRGGNWESGSNGGIYLLSASASPSGFSLNVGFRCAYTE